MKTDDLIRALSMEVAAVPRMAMARQMALWLVPATGLSLLIMLFSIGVRPDLEAALGRPAIWVKFGIVLALGLAAMMAVTRASRPERNGTPWLVTFGALAAVAAALGIWQLTQIDTSRWMKIWLGGSSAECPFLIVMLAVPIFLAMLGVMRNCAPTNLRVAGAAAGLLAGGIAALVYSLHCGEAAIIFVATWYVGGIALVGAIGALIGPRVLRW